MKPLRLLVCTAALLLGWGRVQAQTTSCPTVSTNVSVVNAFITGSPTPIGLATYDQTTLGLSIQFAGPGNKAIYLVGVPKQLIIGRASTPWAALRGLPQALVQYQSPCPILGVDGKPIITTGLPAQTFSPFVTSPCPIVTGPDRLQLIPLVNTPFRVYLAVYDTISRFFLVQFADGMSAMFVNVPATALRGQTDWNTLAIYQEAIMAVNSACPLLAVGSPQYDAFGFGVAVFGAFGIGGF